MKAIFNKPPRLPAAARKACTLAAVAALTACASVASHAAPITVKLIGFNDFHGTLQSPGTFGINTTIPAAQRPAVGGAEYLAAYVARMKATNPLNVVVGAGDFIGASPLISALFFDEPAVEVMNRIGLEFNAVGNHEFDKGSGRVEAACRTAVASSPNGRARPEQLQGPGLGAQPGTFDGAKLQVALGQCVRDRDRSSTLLAGLRHQDLQGHARSRSSA